MALILTIPPAMWTRLAENAWVCIDPLDDPLLRAELHQVSVQERDGHVWIDVTGPNAGVRVQSAPPRDGGPW